MKNFKLKQLSLVIMTAVGVLSLTACNDDKKEKELTVEEKIALLEKQKQAQQKPVEAPKPATVGEQPKEVVQEATQTTPVVASKPEDKVYKLSLKNSYSLSKQSAIDSFNAKDYQMAIESLTEGLVLKPYRDNIGCAIGFGYNYYFRTKNEVQNVFGGANVNQGITDTIKAVSNKNEACIVNTTITAENARRIAKVDTEKNFKPGVIKLVGGEANWNKLNPHEQQTLLYFPQKMGLGGSQKFKTLWASIKEYANNKTDANRQKVLNAMVVKYKIKDKEGNWVQKTDTRSHLLMSAMFTSPETFASILGTSGADTGSFVKVAKSVKVNIDTSKNIEEQVNENDDLNKTLSEITGTPEVQILDESNKVIDVKKSFETTPAQIQVQSTSSSNDNAMAMVGLAAIGGEVSKPTKQTKQEKNQDKGSKSVLEESLGEANANELHKKGYAGKNLGNGMIEVTGSGQSASQSQSAPKKNQVCQKTVVIQGQPVTVPVPCDQ